MWIMQLKKTTSKAIAWKRSFYFLEYIYIRYSRNIYMYIYIYIYIYMQTNRSLQNCNVIPPGRQGKHMWPKVRQPPMKADWWYAPLMLRDLAEATRMTLTMQGSPFSYQWGFSTPPPPKARPGYKWTHLSVTNFLSLNPSQYESSHRKQDSLITASKVFSFLAPNLNGKVLQLSP